jgi:hypothetical protein
MAVYSRSGVFGSGVCLSSIWTGSLNRFLKRPTDTCSDLKARADSLFRPPAISKTCSRCIRRLETRKTQPRNRLQCAKGGLPRIQRVGPNGCAYGTKNKNLCVTRHDVVYLYTQCPLRQFNTFLEKISVPVHGQRSCPITGFGQARAIELSRLEFPRQSEYRRGQMHRKLAGSSPIGMDHDHLRRRCHKPLRYPTVVTLPSVIGGPGGCCCFGMQTAQMKACLGFLV